MNMINNVEDRICVVQSITVGYRTRERKKTKKNEYDITTRIFLRYAWLITFLLNELGFPFSERKSDAGASKNYPSSFENFLLLSFLFHILFDVPPLKCRLKIFLLSIRIALDR